MRSSYLLGGFGIGMGILGGLLWWLHREEDARGWWVFGMFVPLLLLALAVGNRLWKGLWRFSSCPACATRLSLQIESIGQSRRWGYRCAGCETFFDSGVSESDATP